MSPEGGDMTPETETRPMSEAGRLTNVFMDPKAAFADIAARPRPWVPLIIFIVMNMILVHCSHERVGWESFMAPEDGGNSRVQQMSAEQREQAIQMQLKFVPYMAYLGPLIGGPIGMLAIAGVVIAGGSHLRLRDHLTDRCFPLRLTPR